MSYKVLGMDEIARRRKRRFHREDILPLMLAGAITIVAMIKLPILIPVFIIFAAGFALPDTPWHRKWRR